ncbi:hypothetical protein TSTA_010470 [Talaromyces stipitatus ATCC 10500]|uniref:Rhodopsin domain-containing protein n=1 Tax=Talaromyces stipitatus (strain ATCC 10500 / CBS 375.48 / QM 6759 / NRRL 1006) TaxID=441959 RepID=B8MG62_TALSN|nr:uncharacterized protein TSTA_010470 [Talaromyces stipitatus ATCC 10500]EED15929.1 hypothetical protein TSTA_010470 [Talaromyces stipitatus ATCC 10500]
MDIPRPNEGDVNIGEILYIKGTDIFRGCWVLTCFVGVVLIFRCAIKAWVRWALPQVSAPGRIWGIEDVFFLFGYAVDLLHMTLIQHSYKWGLGRHFFYLTPEEKRQALRWDYASQPCAVAAAMISRTGMMWFLLSCFANSNRRLRISIIVCMIIQIVVNSITIVQIVVQCGPNPYHADDRTRYFHYMWDPLPADGSVKCQSPTVQTTIGYVQGGFNTIIDLYLAGISAFELWQFFIQTLQRNPGVSVWVQFSKINPSVRSRRIWQTLTLSGPLVLSGAASIVKTYLLQSLGDRADFTYNIVTFVLWVKIENYAILIATCAPVIRLFLRTFVDMRREGRYGGYPWSRSHSDNPHNSNENNSGSSGQHELKRQNKFQQRFNRSRSAVDPDKTFDSMFDDSYLLTTVDDDKDSSNRHANGTVGPSSHTIDTIARMTSPASINDNRNTRLSTGVGVTVKTDIVVEVDEEMGMSPRSRGLSPLPKNAQPYPTFTPQDDQHRVERQALAYAWKPAS